MSVIVTGSLAFDYIMNFPGSFQDHILPDKIHVLSVSFLVNSLKRQRGGTAGNIAYNAALLGLTPRVIADAGADFASYRATLDECGVDTSAIRIDEDDTTASCFITTDQTNNQIMAFYPGAMRRSGERALADLTGADAELAIIAPDDPAAMRRYPRECRELGLPYIYDPGMQLPWLSREDLLDGLTGARVLIGNDHEMALIRERTGLDGAALRERAEIVITTLGAHGSEIDARGEIWHIPAAPPREVVDPTGAGDAFRAGLMLGLTRDFPLELAGRLAAQAATYAVEMLGPQEHRYEPAGFARRFNESFSDVSPLGAELVPRGAVARR